VAADRGDRVVDAGALGGRELAEVVGDLADQVRDPGDFLFRWEGFGSGPVVQAGGGQHAFAAAEPVVEVGAQVGR
jgi:hypothetical protein